MLRGSGAAAEFTRPELAATSSLRCDEREVVRIVSNITPGFRRGRRFFCTANDSNCSGSVVSVDGLLRSAVRVGWR